MGDITHNQHTHRQNPTGRLKIAKTEIDDVGELSGFREGCRRQKDDGEGPEGEGECDSCVFV